MGNRERRSSRSVACVDPLDFEPAIEQVADVPFQIVLWLNARARGGREIVDRLSCPVSRVRTHVGGMHHTKIKLFQCGKLDLSAECWFFS
jgi:hypothetical protein